MKLTVTLEIEMTPDEMLKALSPEAKERIAEKENKMFLKFAEGSANQDEKVGRQLAETLSGLRATWIAREAEKEAQKLITDYPAMHGAFNYSLSQVTGNSDVPLFVTDARVDSEGDN